MESSEGLGGNHELRRGFLNAHFLQSKTQTPESNATYRVLVSPRDSLKAAAGNAKRTQSELSSARVRKQSPFFLLWDLVLPLEHSFLLTKWGACCKEINRGLQGHCKLPNGVDREKGNTKPRDTSLITTLGHMYRV